MPVTISGDAYKRIEAIAAGLSDERLRDLTIQLRDSLVGTLRNTKWGAGDIGRGLTQYTEPVRTATGGWMVGIGDLDILHRDPLKGEGVHSIEKFLDWYEKTYLPAEKAKKAARPTVKKPEISPTAKRAQRLRQEYQESLRLRTALRVADLRDVDLRERLYKLRAERNDAVRGGRVGDVAKKDASLGALAVRMEDNLRRMREAEHRLAELRAQR